MSRSNKVAVITGAGTGIGKGVARVFAKRGIDVVIAGRTFEKLEKTAEELKLPDVEIYPVKADISVISDVEKLFDFTMEKFGKVDILVNNAGIAEPMAPITDLDLKLVEDVININFKGQFYCARRAVKEMKARKSGNIINISSIDGLLSFPGTIYGPMKAALNQFTKVLSRELAAIPIRVNCICPGLVHTEMMDGLNDRDIDVLLKYIPMRAIMSSDDIGYLAYFLASDEARYITGSVIAADEGISADGGWYSFVSGEISPR